MIDRVIYALSMMSSLIFWSFFVVYGMLWTPVLLIALIIDRRLFRMVAFVSAHACFALHFWVCGARHRWSGLENIPDGKCIIAIRHESYWETLMCGVLLSHPVWILKKDLLNVPLVGWLLRALGCIGVDRSKGVRALSDVNEKAKKMLSREPAQIVIFPHGTRVDCDDFTSPIKRGVVSLYEAQNVPCVPVALTSSGAWPRFPAPTRRGPMIMEFMPAIEPGLPRKEFMEKLEAALTHRSRELREKVLAGNR